MPDDAPVPPPPPSPHEPAPHDSSPHDSSPRDSSPHDSSRRDSSPHDSSRRDQQEWRRRRDAAALDRAAVEERARARESARARALLDAFLAEVRRRGVPPEPLRARAGAARYRTGLTGWSLRDDGSVGVSEAGDFYVLVTPASVRARVLGVVLHPTDPPLQVGRGGRDGESIDLADLLALRLA